MEEVGSPEGEMEVGGTQEGGIEEGGSPEGGLVVVPPIMPRN
jgi:hypothetical protein